MRHNLKPATECLLLCQGPLTHVLAHNRLQHNNLNDDAKKALRDAAGSDIKIEF